MAIFRRQNGKPQLRIVDCGMGIEKGNPKIRNPQFNRLFLSTPWLDIPLPQAAGKDTHRGIIFCLGS